MMGDLFNTAKSLKLFNFKWYSEYYNHTFSSEKEAFIHYIESSRHTNINPSPDFCSKKYLKAYPDVAHTGCGPLEHYLKYGHKEQRQIFKVDSVVNPYAVADKPRSNFKNRLKIAVCLHIFYGDYVDRLAQALKNFPANVDVLITTSCNTIKENAEIAFATCNNVKDVSIRVVPNRGRNFGPLLVEYGSILSDYDLFVHLHSKKSLYSGRDQVEWADYNIKYLLGCPRVTEAVLHRFHLDDSIGLYFPTTYRGLPFFANHWLKNHYLASKLFKKTTINNTYLSYPVSGMFWARPKALKGLIDQHYSYDDFPSEPLANDGTYLHAIERIVAPVCESNGYKKIYYYSEYNRIRYTDEYVVSDYKDLSYEHIRSNYNNFASLSFDLFDTLFVRKYYFPDMAKKELGEMLTQEGLFNSPEDFVSIRNKTEHQLRQRNQFVGDVSIIDVYDELLNCTDLANYTSKELADLEYQIDAANFMPREKLINIIRDQHRLGKKICFITDTYYTKKQIIDTLDRCNIDFDYHLYVSSDLSLRKDNATMWEHLLREKLILKKHHLHTGDNTVSDVQIPGDLGIKSQIFLNPMDKWLRKHADIPTLAYSIFDREAYFWGRLISNNGLSPFFNNN